MGFDESDLDRTICFCNCVSLGELLRDIRAGNRTLEQIQQCNRATTGCGGCEPEVLEILEAELARLAEAEATTAKKA
jgi:NAD(P)H-nitrite reductase large subunit